MFKSFTLKTFIVVMSLISFSVFASEQGCKLLDIGQLNFADKTVFGPVKNSIDFSVISHLLLCKEGDQFVKSPEETLRMRMTPSSPATGAEKRLAVRHIIYRKSKIPSGLMESIRRRLITEGVTPIDDDTQEELEIVTATNLRIHFERQGPDSKIEASVMYDVLNNRMVHIFGAYVVESQYLIPEQN